MKTKLESNKIFNYFKSLLENLSYNFSVVNNNDKETEYKIDGIGEFYISLDKNEIVIASKKFAHKDNICINSCNKKYWFYFTYIANDPKELNDNSVNEFIKNLTDLYNNTSRKFLNGLKT